MPIEKNENPIVSKKTVPCSEKMKGDLDKLSKVMSVNEMTRIFWQKLLETHGESRNPRAS